jgi:iron complex outermembrane receptor protein
MTMKFAGYPAGVAIGLAISSAATYSSTANALDAAAAEGDTSLGKVTVTARRREEKSQDVPLAISVLNAQAIEATGTLNIGKLQQLQPSIQFYSSNPRNSAANIRGMGAPFGLTNDGIEQGVGIYVDQVYYARSAAATFDFLDVDQIEVLRGPQGTLYGKNTTAGAINITSKKPSFTPEGKAELTLGNLDLVQAKGSFSAPIIDDTLAFRLGTSYTHRRGTIYNVTSQKWINEQDNLGFKGQLLFIASDTLDITLSGDYSHSDPYGFGTVYVRAGATQRGATRQYAGPTGLAAASGYAPPSTDPFDRLTDIDAELQAEQYFGGTSILANWDTGAGTLTSVTAYRKWDWYPQNDRDFIGLPITTKSQNPSKQRQYSQELRFAATSAEVDYVVGLYGFYQTVDTKGLQVQGSAASRWLLGGALQSVPATLDGLSSQNDIGLKNTSLAVFGQATWHVTDKLNVQPGLRFNYDKKKGKYIATVSDATGAPVNTTPPLTATQTAQLGVLAPQSYQPEFDDTNLSGDFTVSYALTPDVLSYLTYARSFKSGGINLSGLPLNAANTDFLDLSLETVKPERVNHYETGLKTQFLNRKLTLNLSAYWTDISDYQATVNNGQATVIRGYLANADKVRVRGVEADLSVRPIEQLNLYVNGALTDHKYVSFKDAPCPPELSGGGLASAANPASAPGTVGGFSPLVCDISGQWLPGISKVAFSYGFEYKLPLPAWDADSNAYFGFDGSYRSKWSSNPSRSAYTDVAGYALANFRAGVRKGKGLDVFAWVRNAFDREYFDFLQTQPSSTGLVVGQPGDPRTYGVTVKASF